MHISVFWIYTAWNSPSIYAQKNTTTATRPMIFSMSALGGDVHDPDSVEVDQKMQERSLFEIGLEEGL
jgi:hypothetical protein